MNILDLLLRRRPVKRGSLLGARFEPAALAQTMDASRLSGVLRSAESGNMGDYFALCRDVVTGHGHTQAQFATRKLAVLGNTQSLAAVNEVQLETTIAAAIGKHLEGLPSWFDATVHLLDSTLFPVAVVEKIWKVSDRPGWRYELAELRPVPYRLLDYSTGTLRIRDVGPDGEPLGTTHEPEPLRYIIHRGHLLTSTPDTWGGPMRAVLFWWLFATQNRDWWVRNLERFGAPFLEGTYNKDDDQSRYSLERAFSAATRLFGIAVPDDASVKIHQANASQSGDAFEQFQSAANKEISKIILGQTTSADAQSTGLGSSIGKEQGEVRDDIRQFDALRLASTIRTQLLAEICRLNGWPVDPPRIAWGGDDIAELDITGDLLKSLRDAGIRVTEEGIKTLSKRMAIPLERDTSPARPTVGPLSALASPDPGRTLAARSDDAREAIDKLASSAAPTLSEELAKALLPLSAAVSASTSLSDLEARLRSTVPGLDLRSAADVAAGVMVAAAANAASASRQS
jgi:phage gp29-like protein